MNEVQVDAGAVIRRLQERLAEATYNVCVLEAQVEALNAKLSTNKTDVAVEPTLETVNN